MTRNLTTGLAGFLLVLCAAALPANSECPCGSLGEGGSGPIRTIPATPMARGRFYLSFRTEYADMDRIADERLAALAMRDMDVASADFRLTHSLSAAYGLTEDLSVAASLPYVNFDDVRRPYMYMLGMRMIHQARNHGDPSGLGDLMLAGQTRLVGRSAEDLQVAVAAGLRLPTGTTDEQDRYGERFSLTYQPSSGAWNPFASLSVSRSFGVFSLHLNFQYLFATEGAQEIHLGDTQRYNFAAVCRLTAMAAAEGAGGGAVPPTRSESTPMTWDLIAELNLERQQRMSVGGEKMMSCGGDTLFLSPGVRLNLGGAWSVFSSLGIPVWQEMNENAQETDLRVVFGLGAGF